jgi:tRNA A-37 threonylcarbamoyl transferase component Bud32
MSDLIGQSVGRYRIVERLGTGGMATVYKAFDARLERDVAIKFIRSDVVRDEMFLARFEREAKALARLSHPNIVAVLDYGDHEGAPYLVMEYVKGDTLKRKLGQVIPWKDAAKMLMSAAQALEYTHQQNIVHRDVKPSNFLVSSSDHLMLTDFGIAKMLDREYAVDLTGTGVGIGTPEYMAPEQGLGKKVDQRADVYSLGIVLYEMVTGHKPFRADTPMAVMYKQISDPLPSPTKYVPDLPDFVQKVIFKALAKGPEDRYQDMGSFAKALEGLSQQPETQRAPSPETMPMERSTRVMPPPEAIPMPVEQLPRSVSQPEVKPKPVGKKRSRLWIACGVVAMVAICAVVMLVTGGFGALMAIFGPDPEGLAVDVVFPATVEVGQEFDMIFSLSNVGDKEFTVTQIQIPNSLLSAVVLTDIYPPNDDQHDFGEETGYDFDLTLMPGDVTTVSFRFGSLVVGNYPGEIEVVVGGTRRKRTELNVVITEAQVVQVPTATNTLEIPSPPTITPEVPTPFPPTDTPITAAGPVLWDDDFSDPNSGFYSGTDVDGTIEYRAGEYLLEVIPNNRIVWVNLGNYVRDVEISVDMRVVQPTGNTGHGVLCRYQDVDNFYGLEISEDGYYTIWRRQNAEYTFLVDWQYLEALVQDRPIRITVSCVGDRLSLAADGVLLAETNDSTFTSGDIGVLVETYDVGNALIAFDNFYAVER